MESFRDEEGIKIAINDLNRGLCIVKVEDGIVSKIYSKKLHFKSDVASMFKCEGNNDLFGLDQDGRVYKLV